MTPDVFYHEILAPGLQHLATIGGPVHDVRAEALLLAIAGQESEWTHRVQRVKTAKGWHDGPARGWWQFERSGGVAGVMNHPTSAGIARTLCTTCEVMGGSRAVWTHLASDDRLATGMARLLLWTDRRALPAIGDQDGAWECYLRNWRPGRPRPEHWPHNYRAALAVLALDKEEI